MARDAVSSVGRLSKSGRKLLEEEFKRTERLNEAYEGKLGVKDNSKYVQLEG